MKFILIWATSCLFVCTCLGQEFVPESSDDCLDRFQSMYLKVNQRYAIVGSAKVSSIDMPHLSMTHEWFACEDMGSLKVPGRFYYESRILYPHAPQSNLWEKRYMSDKKILRSVGDYLEEIKELKRGEDVEEEQFYRGSKMVGCPNLFSIAVLAPGGSLLLAERGVVLSVLNKTTVFTEWEDGEDVVGKYYGPNFVKEFRFSKDSGYMPTKAKSYFYTPNKSNAPPKPEEYKILWHESEAQWEKVGDDTWVPVRVTSILHRSGGPKSKKGKEIEASGRWELKIDQNVISDDNAKLLPLEGPMAELRSKLVDRKEKAGGKRK